MIYLKIDDTLYPAGFRQRVQDPDWDNRGSMAITLTMAHTQAAELFVDGLQWQHVLQPDPYVDAEDNTITPDTVITDYSDYEVAGSITDHRDGTLTVKMGKPTADELLAIMMGG